MTTRGTSSARLTIFAAVVVAMVGLAGYYVYRVRAELPRGETAARNDSTSDAEAFRALRQQPYVAFRDMRPGPQYGRLAFASLDDRERRLVTNLACNRIYFAPHAGVCLAVATRPAGYRGYLMDGSLEPLHSFDIPGTPSRARVSRDGAVAAYTVFVGVDSYLAAGLSTRTRLLDVESGRELADLETFEVRRDGRTIHAADFNFWGVTFTRDPSRFFATLGTNGHTYLVDGDRHGRTLTVEADDVECPSLSPDGTRIAFKKRFGSGLTARWQPALLDLATLATVLLPEPRHVDDQIEWLDDGHILYGLGHSLSAAQRRSDVWVLATDGASEPAIFIADAESPAVVRP